MGYYARGYGEIVLQNNQEVQDILSMQDFYFDEIDCGDTLEITIDDSGNYSEEDLHSFLRAITPFVIESSDITYQGESNDFWRFVFKNGKWFEQNGVIEYETPGNPI